MKVLTWQDFLENVPHARIAATVGVFDGLHLGHQALIETVRKEAPQLKPCVITFRENPKKYFIRQVIAEVFSRQSRNCPPSKLRALSIAC
jgi:cytidyltransferase-related domain